jgi:hypothetical protein
VKLCNEAARVCISCSLALKMAVIHSPKTSINLHQKVDALRMKDRHMMPNVALCPVGSCLTPGNSTSFLVLTVLPPSKS